MKTTPVILQIQHRIQQYEVLFFILISSFALMGGCNDKKDEIPADEVTTEVQQAPAVPLWVPVNTDPSIRFYFIPEMGIYYDAYLADYVYWNGNYWMYSPVLPHGYVYFDLFDANIVFLTAGISHPWHHHHHYVSNYPVYFFAGANYHHSRHGWRYYDENRGKFIGVHRNAKYDKHYNIHPNKNGIEKPRGGKNGFDAPKQQKNRQQHSPEGIKQQNKQENNYRMQDNKSGSKKEQPSMNKQQSGKKTIQSSGHREVKPRTNSEGKRKMSQGGGSKEGGGKKGGGGR